MNENALAATALVVVLFGFSVGIATAAMVQGVAVFFGTGHMAIGFNLGVAIPTFTVAMYLYYNPGVLIRMMPDEEGW